jgi:hypothetical protein
MAHTAPPVDIADYPAVRAALDEIHAEEEALCEEIVAVIVAAGEDPDVTASYDLHFSYYNYLTTAYSLKVIGEELEKGLAGFDALVDESASDPELYELMRSLRDRKAAIVARIAELRKLVAAGPQKSAAKGGAAPSAAAGAGGAGHAAHGAAAHHGH